MRALFTAVLLLSAAASAADVTVNAAEGRQPIPTELYSGVLGDEGHQAELIEAHGLALPVGDVARVALLGILGREGLVDDWPATPEQATALKMFLDYDGEGGRFGDTSIVTTSSSGGLLAFAAYDSDARVTVLLVSNGMGADEMATVGFKGMGQKGGWRAFELGADGKVAFLDQGTTYDAVIRHAVRPSTALLVEYRPTGGILPLAPAPLDAITPAVQQAYPAAHPAEDAAQPMGCQSVSMTAPFAWIAALLIALRVATLGPRS